MGDYSDYLTDDMFDAEVILDDDGPEQDEFDPELED